MGEGAMLELKNPEQGNEEKGAGEVPFDPKEHIYLKGGGFVKRKALQKVKEAKSRILLRKAFGLENKDSTIGILHDEANDDENRRIEELLKKKAEIASKEDVRGLILN